MMEIDTLSNMVKTKTALSYETLRQRIVNGVYKPGEKLIIHEVAENFGFSAIPIREALKTLEAEGLVSNTPHIGFVVTKPNFANQAQLFEVRQLLEGHAIWLATGRITPKALEDLKQLVKEMRDNISDVEKLSELNYRYHYLIYSFSGNNVLYKLIQQGRAMAPRTKSIYSLVENRIESAVTEHEGILRYLIEGNAEKAKKALLKHQETSYQLLMHYYSGH